MAEEIKTESEFLRLALRSGFATLEEIEKWAEAMRESNPDQEEVLEELLIARLNGKYETGQLLGQISGHLDWTLLEEKIRARVRKIYGTKGSSNIIPLIEGISIVASEFPSNSEFVYWNSILDDRRQLYLDGLCDFSEVEFHFKDFLSK